jgi:fumarylacetoacetase
VTTVNDTSSMTWVPGVGDAHPFGRHNLPYGAARWEGSDQPRLVVRIGDYALDLLAACQALRPDLSDLVRGPVLNPLLAAGRASWIELRTAISTWLGDHTYRAALEPHLRPLDRVELALAFEVADYVDFYASEHHATNIGRLFRPGSPPLTENWKHLPIGYHGRAGTVVVSGTPVRRPSGQQRGASGPSGPIFGPSVRLDIEAEIGFVLGGATTLGQRVALAQARDHIFGVCIVNDWSARDLQAWEYVPLGPFLGKSFATSVSPWIVPLDAFDTARVPPPARDPELLPYLDDSSLEPWALDIDLRVRLNGGEISRPPFASMYWTAAQMLAHMTVNGATVRPGDLFASGTVSGAVDGEQGSLIELTVGGAHPLRLADGSERSFLLDGDEVTISARVPATGSRPEVGLGEVSGRIEPAVNP